MVTVTRSLLPSVHILTITFICLIGSFVFACSVKDEGPRFTRIRSYCSPELQDYNGRASLTSVPESIGMTRFDLNVYKRVVS